ncbi:hypothetical protein EPA93_09350 [Ktedonosporobacter rubrisoli]|uniref:Uncharacterized protein n=1 Tax=Ktedonosporobacter rubrisoli TaxID=2509675 RepID=A0A4P6JLW1_KTERU|nr:hypothetical protein [Ktedonosporobacter rubrisoli]QBD76205.1 hypothetical protein EPA93_09350 [Ktedonosporobacter rubrisoli]
MLSIPSLEVPAPQEVLNVLEKLNQANQAYDIRLPAEQRQRIAAIFHIHYVWLLQHHISFGYDRVRQRYFLQYSTVSQEVTNR